MSLKQLNEKSKSFTSTGFDNIKDETRLLFISKFPIESIKDLTVDCETSYFAGRFLNKLTFKEINE